MYLIILLTSFNIFAIISFVLAVIQILRSNKENESEIDELKNNYLHILNQK